VVTKENLSEFTIEDVVMPMIGYDVQLPENEDLKTIILDILKQDDLSMQNFAD